MIKLPKRLTPYAKESFLLAQKQAKSLGHKHLCIEHLFLEMVRRKISGAKSILECLNLPVKKIERSVSRSIRRRSISRIKVHHLFFLELMKNVRRKLKNDQGYVGTDDLIIFILNDSKNPISKKLAKYGLTDNNFDYLKDKSLDMPPK